MRLSDDSVALLGSLAAAAAVAAVVLEWLIGLDVFCDPISAQS